MKFSQSSFKEISVKEHDMVIGQMISIACQAVIQAGDPEMEIRLVDVDEGSVEKWCGVVGIMTHDWVMDWKVKVFQMCIMIDNRTEKNYLKVIFADGEEDEDDA